MTRLLSFFALFAFLCGHLSAAEQRPNILLIMVDDMGYSDIGCYGGEIRTPTLDALAVGGVRLARFYNCAQCCPSRASLMSGLYPHQAGVGDMNEQGAANELWRRIGSPAYLGFKKEGVVTLPESLREAGYQTFMAGKWHLGQDEACWPGQRGFERHFALIGGACEQFTGYRSWQKKGPITKFVHNGQRVEKLPPDFYTTDSFTDHHSLDFVHWIFDIGAPKAVSSSGGRFFLKGNGEVPDTQDAIIEYPKFNTVVQFRECAAGAGASGMGALTFMGTRGTMTLGRDGFEILPDKKIDPINSYANIIGRHPVGGPQPVPEPEGDFWCEKAEDKTGDWKGMYVEHAKNFFDCIKSRKTPNSDLASSHWVSTTCHLANISARTGRKVVWDATANDIQGDKEASAMLQRPYRAPWDAELKAVLA
jgi:hypothetical protein